MNKQVLLVLACAGVLLAACGGGGGGNPAQPPDPDAMDQMPTSAVATVQAFHGTLGGLAADDRKNPLSLDGVLPPTSETAEPLALD